MGFEAERPVEWERRCCCVTAQHSKACSVGSCHPLDKNKQSTSKYQTSFHVHINPFPGLCSLFAWKLDGWMFFFSSTPNTRLPNAFICNGHFSTSDPAAQDITRTPAGWSCPFLLLLSPPQTPHADTRRSHTGTCGTAVFHRFGQKQNQARAKLKIQLRIWGKKI